MESHSTRQHRTRLHAQPAAETQKEERALQQEYLENFYLQRALSGNAAFPPALPPQGVIRLQSTIGNQATQRLLRREQPIPSAPVSTLHADGSRTVQRVPWYKPWIQEQSFEEGGTLAYANLELDTRESVDSGWQRDAVGTGLLAAVAGLAGTVITKRLGLSQLLSMIAGGASAFARGYKGYHVQERVWGETIQYHNWYGRYRFNVLTGNLTAVRFSGRGPSRRTIIAPYFYQQRVADADGNVVYTHTRHELTIPGIRVEGHTPLPEEDWGEWE
ncbi:MAG TPA: hypothetical protein VKY59_19695 [Spirillospora sp.]|nr:hypothetical protein [Spirillospora sp.]